jgi:hypothetical protein
MCNFAEDWGTSAGTGILVMMATLITTAVLGFSAPSVISRRQILLGAGGYVAANTASSTNAAIPTTTPKAVLIRDGFSTLKTGGLLDWYEQHLTDGFVAEIDGIAYDRATFMALQSATLKSFPDLEYTPKNLGTANVGQSVGWTAAYRGTLSGAPFSPLPGVPVVTPRSPPVQVGDKAYVELAMADFAPGTEQIEKLTLKQIKPGPGKYSGPINLYTQAGGDASKLPPLP